MPETESPVETELLVLVVEDDDQDFFLLKRRLKQAHDVRFIRVTTVADATTALAEKDLNLVLLDLSLPDSKGMDTVKVIVGKSSAPVVVLTATDDERTGLEALHIGAQDYLIKGHFDNTLLTRTIRYAVERYKLLDELNESREMIHRARELSRLKNISLRDGEQVAMDSHNDHRSLKERFKPTYQRAMDTYAVILDSAIEQRAFKVNNHVPTRLQKLANLLGSWRAVPNDIVEIHSAVLAGRLSGMESGKSRVCNEEARYLLTGLLGHLCNFYRAHCEVLPESTALDSRASNDSDIGTD